MMRDRASTRVPYRIFRQVRPFPSQTFMGLRMESYQWVGMNGQYIPRQPKMQIGDHDFLLESDDDTRRWSGNQCEGGVLARIFVRNPNIVNPDVNAGDEILDIYKCDIGDAPKLVHLMGHSCAILPEIEDII